VWREVERVWRELECGERVRECGEVERVEWKKEWREDYLFGMGGWIGKLFPLFSLHSNL
jgi:hypothetical protein